jgi:D-glycero-alpha-D-manno-heptose-7-phosphate kinase
MIISRTPYRISLFGGGTDYPSWYLKHGGAVLAATINKYCYLTCRYLPPFFEHNHRIVWSRIETCNTVDEINHPSAREILRFLEVERGVEIHHVGDLPARSGMGSSSSFTVGLLHAVHALKGNMPTKEQLAREGIHIERDVLKETVGSQDQILASVGGFNHIEFHTSGEFTVHPVILPNERAAELQSHLMLFYTGIKRTASNVAGSYANDLDARRHQMRILKDLVTEGLAILNGGGPLRAFGELMHEAWMVKRSLSADVTNEHVNHMYDASIQAGALGGKLTGAGGGGFLLLFVPPERQAAVKEALQDLIHVPIKFEYSGSQIIYYNQEEDFSGLSRDRGSAARSFRELDDIRNGN